LNHQHSIMSDELTEKTAVVELTFTTTAKIKVDDWPSDRLSLEGEELMKYRAQEEAVASPFDYGFSGIHPDSIPDDMRFNGAEVLELK